MTPSKRAPTIPGLDVRPFDVTADYPRVAAFMAETNVHDGVDFVPTAEQLSHEWLTTPGFVPERDARIAEADGRILGMVDVDWRIRGATDARVVAHLVELWVRPDHRRRGLGRALLDWAEGRARQSIEDGTAGPTELPHVIGGFGARHVAGHAELAAAAGYDVARFFFEMRRPLELPIPDAPLPPGLEIRPVTAGQHRAIWDADVEAFRDHWEAAVRTEEDFVGMFEHPEVDTTLWQVAWDGDDVAGSVLNWIIAEENARLGIRRGWLEHVSVRQPWRRQGLAAALIAESLRVLRDRGMTEAALGVDAENPTGALQLYERLGFSLGRTAVLYRKAL
jgi:mycothiol synthase